MVDQNIIRQFNEWATKVDPTWGMNPVNNAKAVLSGQAPNALITKQGLKTLGKYAPLSGDVYDIISGKKKIEEGHPFIGGGQAALGAAGLATLGAGSIGKSTVKGLTKKAVANNIIDKYIAKDILKQNMKTAKTANKISGAIHNPVTMTAGAGLPEMFLWIEDMYNNGGNNKSLEDINTPPSDLPSGASQYNYEGDGKNTSNKSGASQIKQANEIVTEIQPQNNELNTTDNSELIKQYLDMLNNSYGAYSNSLNDYIKNYNKNLGNYHRARDFYTGLAGWSGNSQWADLGKDYNSLQNEANKINLEKQLQDSNISNAEKIYEVMGNIAMAQDMGLPPQAAFANKNLLTAYSMKERDAVKQAIANAQIKAKIYGIDERTALMRELQDLKYKMGVDVANIYMGNDLGGTPGVGLSQQGTAVSPVQYPQQQSAAAGVYAQLDRNKK